MSVLVVIMFLLFLGRLRIWMLVLCQVLCGISIGLFCLFLFRNIVCFCWVCFEEKLVSVLIGIGFLKCRWCMLVIFFVCWLLCWFFWFSFVFIVLLVVVKWLLSSRNVSSCVNIILIVSLFVYQVILNRLVGCSR